ncbi:hypothetical protein ACTXT7_001841 [Hymenolepis weldensis]
MNISRKFTEKASTRTSAPPGYAIGSTTALSELFKRTRDCLVCPPLLEICVEKYLNSSNSE